MLNYTVRAVLWDFKPNKKEIYTLKLVVTVNRRRTYLLTAHKLRENQWDTKTGEVINHPNSKIINADIRKRIAEKEAELIALNVEGANLTPNAIKGIRPSREINLIKYAKETAKKRKNRKGEMVPEIRASKEINRLTAFAGTGMALSDMDPSFMRKYNSHEESRGMSQNTRNATFRYWRRLLNIAKGEKLIKENPFDFWDVPSYQQPDRTYLVEAERNKLLKLKVPEPINTTLVHFLLGCFGGLRHSDWLTFDADEKVEEGFLKVRPFKKSIGYVVLPIGPTLASIIERTRLTGKVLSNQDCNVHLKAIQALAGIKKNLTTHVARHSFGHLCASNKLPKSVAAELMGITVKTVEVYYHLSGENIRDQASVLGKI